MALLTLYDAVTAINLPTNAEYVCFYTDGHYANGAAVHAHVPHAKAYLGITVHGGIADCCDCEVGDLTVAQGEAWIKERLAAGAYRPCIYANQGRWENEGLLSGLAAYGNRIRRWVASYPGAGPVVPQGFDAHQFTDHANNINLDASVCLPNFFDPPPADPHGVAHVALSYDLATGKWQHRGLAGVVHWGSQEKWASVEVQLSIGGATRGQWRTASLPYNSKPLGG